MRYALISDIHGNLEAFQEVVKALSGAQVDDVCFLGDIVGYGADPGRCIELLQGITSFTVAGNHDWAVVDLYNTADFNPAARTAVEWTAGKIASSHRSFLEKLPLTRTLPGIELVHATPFQPGEWHYLFSDWEASRSFRFFEEQVCFVGHSHVPVTYTRDKGGQVSLLLESSITLEESHRYLINVGSVGQPRDGDPRAAYGIYDTGNARFTLKRIPYRVEDTQKKIVAAGLPSFLAERLAEGR